MNVQRCVRACIAIYKGGGFEAWSGGCRLQDATRPERSSPRDVARAEQGYYVNTGQQGLTTVGVGGACVPQTDARTGTRALASLRSSTQATPRESSSSILSGKWRVGVRLSRPRSRLVLCPCTLSRCVRDPPTRSSRHARTHPCTHNKNVMSFGGVWALAKKSFLRFRDEFRIFKITRTVAFGTG